MTPAVWLAGLRQMAARITRIGQDGDTEGQGLVEYALILSLVVVVCFLLILFLGPAVGNIFSNVVNSL